MTQFSLLGYFPYLHKYKNAKKYKCTKTQTTKLQDTAPEFCTVYSILLIQVKQLSFFASRKRICPGNTIFFVAPLSIFTQRRCQHTDKSSATVNIFLAPLGALAGLDF